MKLSMKITLRIKKCKLQTYKINRFLTCELTVNSVSSPTIVLHGSPTLPQSRALHPSPVVWAPNRVPEPVPSANATMLPGSPWRLGAPVMARAPDSPTHSPAIVVSHGPPEPSGQGGPRLVVNFVGGDKAVSVGVGDCRPDGGSLGRSLGGGGGGGVRRRAADPSSPDLDGIVDLTLDEVDEAPAQKPGIVEPLAVPAVAALQHSARDDRPPTALYRSSLPAAPLHAERRLFSDGAHAQAQATRHNTQLKPQQYAPSEQTPAWLAHDGGPPSRDRDQNRRDARNGHSSLSRPPIRPAPNSCRNSTSPSLRHRGGDVRKLRHAAHLRRLPPPPPPPRPHNLHRNDNTSHLLQQSSARLPERGELRYGGSAVRGRDQRFRHDTRDPRDPSPPREIGRDPGAGPPRLGAASNLLGKPGDPRDHPRDHSRGDMRIDPRDASNSRGDPPGNRRDDPRYDPIHVHSSSFAARNPPPAPAPTYAFYPASHSYPTPPASCPPAPLPATGLLYQPYQSSSPSYFPSQQSSPCAPSSPQRDSGAFQALPRSPEFDPNARAGDISTVALDSVLPTEGSLPPPHNSLPHGSVPPRRLASPPRFRSVPAKVVPTAEPVADVPVGALPAVPRKGGTRRPRETVVEVSDEVIDLDGWDERTTDQSTSREPNGELDDGGANDDGIVRRRKVRGPTKRRRRVVKDVDEEDDEDDDNSWTADGVAVSTRTKKLQSGKRQADGKGKNRRVAYGAAKKRNGAHLARKTKPVAAIKKKAMKGKVKAKKAPKAKKKFDNETEEEGDSDDVPIGRSRPATRKSRSVDGSNEIDDSPATKEVILGVPSRSKSRKNLAEVQKGATDYVSPAFRPSRVELTTPSADVDFHGLSDEESLALPYRQPLVGRRPSAAVNVPTAPDPVSVGVVGHIRKRRPVRSGRDVHAVKSVSHTYASMAGGTEGCTLVSPEAVVMNRSLPSSRERLKVTVGHLLDAKLFYPVVSPRCEPPPEGNSAAVFRQYTCPCNCQLNVGVGAVQCLRCMFWIHGICSGLTPVDFSQLESRRSSFLCLSCRSEVWRGEVVIRLQALCFPPSQAVIFGRRIVQNFEDVVMCGQVLSRASNPKEDLELNKMLSLPLLAWKTQPNLETSHANNVRDCRHGLSPSEKSTSVFAKLRKRVGLSPSV